jgi:glycine/D-amino acid oxidase-like deaminating enzyme
VTARAAALPPDAAARSLWSATAAELPPAPPLEGEARADVAVIGAGVLGLSTALALAEAGVNVAVLEAATAGEGASGRNGGLVVPSLPRIGPADVRAKLGDERAARLLALLAGGADALFALIRRKSIACDAVQSGWLNPAHAAVLAPRVQARVAAWQAAGARCVWLDAPETRARLGSDLFHGALFDPSGGHLDPLAYTRGLARAAVAAGAVMYETSPVIGAERRGDTWRLRTARGMLAVTTVLQCTNTTPPGLPGDPGAALAAATVPLFVYQLATQVFSDGTRASVLPGNEAFSDTRNNLLAGRWTASGRLVTGGMAALHAGAMTRLPCRLARRLEAVFPALGPVRFEKVWRGRAALTGDFLPRLIEPAPGWLAATACNGRGLVMTTLLGPALAAFLRTGDAAALPLPITPPRPIRARPFARLVPQLLLPLGDWHDRRAERRSVA